MVSIRPYTNGDYDLIRAWWNTASEPAPLPEMMPEESSFIAEINGVPALAVTVYLTNCPTVAYTENFIGAPQFKGVERREAAGILSSHIASFAKAKGFSNLLCIAHKTPLVGRYEELGYTKTLDGVSTFVRPL